MVFSFMSLYNNSNSVSGTIDTNSTFFLKQRTQQKCKKYYCVAIIFGTSCEEMKETSASM